MDAKRTTATIKTIILIEKRLLTQTNNDTNKKRFDANDSNIYA
jgi:hypothetical protein